MATTCPICHGTGWKPVEREGMKGVTRCECVLAEHTPRQFSLARIPPRFLDCEFDNFEEATDMLKQAKFMSRRYVEEFRPDTDLGLLYVGPPLTGKTHLAVAVLKRLITEKGVSGLYYEYNDLLKQIQASYNPITQISEVSVLEPVLQVDVLLLDNLGAVRPSPWVQDTVGYIINARYNDRRPVLITTNFADEPPVLFGREGASATREDTLGDRVGERVRSRLHAMCKVVLLGEPTQRGGARKATPHF